MDLDIGQHTSTDDPQIAPTTRLDRPVNPTEDHILGPVNAPITLVEYGSYACPQCRAANERITEVRERLGDRLRYVFRHRPLVGNEIARPAAELVEFARTPEQFWDAHVMLMTRSQSLSEDDLQAVAETLGISKLDPSERHNLHEQAHRRVDHDIASSYASGVEFTPTFFINGRRYDGPWDESSFIDAMLGTLGHRVRSAALTFARWAPSAGLLLLIATVFAIVFTNSRFGHQYTAFWQTNFMLALGEHNFNITLLHCVNDALLTVFFLVVGLEIKREFTIGHLASWRAAALPIAAAIGGMLVPALFYYFILPKGPWSIGWGIPMATDTAFAVALIAMLGARVPIELRIFLTAAAIVDDIGAIIVVAVFYSADLHFVYLGISLCVTLLLVLLNKAGIYRVTPYILLGIVLWASVYASGVHATLAGVILAMLIPTRPPPHYKTLSMQADTILSAEAHHSNEQYRRGPSVAALEALDAIHARLESPADHMLRGMAPRSSYLVLPVFALANAGLSLTTLNVINSEHVVLALAIICGLVIGKPVGFIVASFISVRAGLAHKSDAYSWRQLCGTGALAGIGFTMSLFIASQALPLEHDFAVAKIAVFVASILSSCIGVALLWHTTGNTVQNK